MSGYEGRCPSCGGPLVFRLGSSLLRICDHCGVAVARKGAALAAYGKVAELIPTSSLLALGQEGGYEGAPRFDLVGRLQLDYGTGTWDEWLMGFRDGTWAWLSESQGKFHYLGRVPVPPAPGFADLHVGQTLDLGPPGTFVVIEAGEARFVTGQGELPFDVEPGSRLRYADLSGPDGQFATLDYGTGATAEALFVGREVALEDLGLTRTRSDEERRTKVAVTALSCPQCGGPLELHAPDQAQRIACPYCGSLLDATRDLAVLEALSHPPVTPLIPLGSAGRWGGIEWAVIGFMQRSVTAEGVRYPWDEYLLYQARQGFRWLVEAKGHWSFVEPVNAGDVIDRLSRKEYRGQSFRPFQGGTARVDHVLGEFYWAVARGDETDTADYICPPLMLSREGTRKELNWSLGTYAEGEEIWKAFGLTGSPPEPRGIAPHQPRPFGEAGHVYGRFLLGLAVAVFLFLGFTVSGGHPLFQQSVSIPRTAASGSPEAALFTDPFVVPDEGNLEVRVRAPVNNSWLYLDGALVNDETGGLDEFDLEVSYYAGADSDGSWTEGGKEAVAYVAAVPPGRYVMRLAPQWEAGRPLPGYELSVRTHVPRVHQIAFVLLALAAWPLFLAWRHFRFESQRWSESDHPWFTSGGGGDD